MWSRVMRLIKRLLMKQEVGIPDLQPPQTDSSGNRNEVKYLKANDRELQFRMRSLELEAEVLGRRHPEGD